MMKKFGVILAFVSVWALFSAMAWAELPDGVWKDVPSGNANDNYALYVQTYTEQSVVVVLLDNSGEHGARRMYAFLDSDFSDGVDASEVGGIDAQLIIQDFTSQPALSASFTVGGVTSDFQLYQWVSSPDVSHVAKNGIYKNVAPMEATEFNLYFQTYDADPASAIAILTPDGGATYYAFLVGDLDNGFDTSDLLEEGAQLSIEFTPISSDLDASAQTDVSPANDEEPPYAFTPPGGVETTGTLFKWFQGPAYFGTYTIGGQVHFNGTPFPVISNLQPRFHYVFDYDLDAYSDIYELTYDSSTGMYTIQYFPADGAFSINFAIDPRHDYLPGNFYSYISSIEAGAMSESERENVDIPLTEVIHLTAPYDNTQIIYARGEYPSLSSPVTFTWEAVDGVTRWRVVLDRYRSPDHPDGYGFIENLVTLNDVTETTYSTGALASSASNEHYQFFVEGFAGDDLIAKYYTVYTDGYGGDFRFRIVP